jgi:lipoprotein LprG
MPGTHRVRVTAAGLAVGLLSGVLLTAACTHRKAAALPAASELLTGAAGAMREVKTAHFTIDAKGSISGLALHHADGKLTREGEALGTATLDQAGVTVEVEFVIVGDKLYLKGPTGGFQQLPLALASSVYDPSAILDPDRGVVKLLSTARDARTEAKEPVDGQDAYRVAFGPDAQTMQTLIPGVGAQATAKVWLAAGSKRLLKGTFTLPATSSNSGGTVTIGFTDYDAPVTINAP